LQELQQWGADLNAVVYEGDQTARALIREYEFYTADEAPLFDVLVTSYDLSMRDNSCLQRFEWSCIIVDEGHRVKNMRSKLGSLLKKQTADFRLLLTVRLSFQLFESLNSLFFWSLHHKEHAIV
jgi:SNF2 family DNA or RNA helicase